MNNTFETMIKHPIATALLIACVANGISNIIATVRGGSVTPVVNVVNEKKYFLWGGPGYSGLSLSLREAYISYYERRGLIC